MSSATLTKASESTMTATQKKVAQIGNGFKPNGSQVLILQMLAKHPVGLTRAELVEKSGAACTTDNLGPVVRGSNDDYPDSLSAHGLVKPEKDEGEDVRWVITSKGKKLAEKVKTRKRAEHPRVPNKSIDPVVMRFRATRTYGLELYTDADIKEIRSQLPKEFAELPVDELRQQIVSRRKQGAFSDPKEKLRASVEKAVREFGPDGSIARILTKKQVEQMQGLLQ